MYRLSYPDHYTLTQAAYHYMQAHNKAVNYNKDLTLTRQQMVAKLYRTKTNNQLLDIVERYRRYQEKQNHKKLIRHNQKQIILPRLQNLTDQQVELIATKLQQLEEHFYLQLDTDYNSKQSIIQSYQQVLAYKYYNIPVQPKEQEEILVGNQEILEKGAL